MRELEVFFGHSSFYLNSPLSDRWIDSNKNPCGF